MGEEMIVINLTDSYVTLYFFLLDNPKKRVTCFLEFV